ncbi:MAG: glutamine synthetase type III, partial [Candidatus Eisenbacteria bacterium]|nr:glutamine synthetase type III [Candidatus Eisenbacteria bacterium]
AILSAFVGQQLTDIIERLMKGEAAKDPEHFMLEMGVGKLPAVAKDNTDRNRTSPFAFTGNKFEFRAVGSSQNCAVPMTVLNSAASSALHQMTERLKKKLDGKPAHRDQAVVELLREVFTETAAVRFEGNGYSEEWKNEAKKRGLPNLADTPAAIVEAMKAEHHAFLVSTGVLSQLEVDARFNVAVERYIKQVTLEAETLLDVVNTAVIPAVERQLASTGAAWRVLSEAAGNAKGSAYGKRVTALASGLETLQDGAARIQKLIAGLHEGHDELAACATLGSKMRPLMQEVREASDALEALVDDEHWPLPKYREMLFVK